MGRPAEFDRDEVLDRAMATFWNQGYCATSIADLTQTTELKPGSLYAAFKSKNGLFMAALDHYGDRSVEAIQRLLTTAETPLAGVRSFLTRIADEASEPASELSCFLVNTALEVARRDPSVREQVKRHLAAIEALFRQALELAQESGELSPDKNPDALATFIMTNVWGLRIRLAAGGEPERVRMVVGQLLCLLD